MSTFQLWCASCLAKEHRRGSPDVKAWSVCEHCHSVDNVYSVVALDPLDERVHTATIDASVGSVLLIKRNGRKTTLRGVSHCARWIERGISEGVATKISGERITYSFVGETFEDAQDIAGREVNLS